MDKLTAYKEELEHLQRSVSRPTREQQNRMAFLQAEIRKLAYKQAVQQAEEERQLLGPSLDETLARIREHFGRKNETKKR